jgi:hypothetical protein
MLKGLKMQKVIKRHFQMQMVTERPMEIMKHSQRLRH